METLASIWAHDPGDLREKRHEPLAVWESQCVFNESPPAGPMWTEQLSPHLQRNKQLQDTLLQREEELVRLQQENNKLREFLNSSFVKNLEQKAKKLTTDGRRKLKRNLTHLNNDISGQQLVASKRVCRNLTAELCSESSDTSASSEPNLDLWILRTLGLKDRDTIDTSSESSSGYSLRGLLYDAASSPEYSVNSSFSSPVATSTPSSVHSYCHQTDCQYSAAECQEANCDNSAQSAQTATGLTGRYEDPEAAIRIFDTSTAFQSDGAEICSLTSSSRVQTEENSANHQVYWSPLPDNETPPQDTILFSPPGERVHFKPMSSSSQVAHQPWMPAGGCSPTSPPAAPQLPATLQTPRSRTDLAFSMSLSANSSVKTHSFTQGQAFVRRDVEGRWNFTWVPRQGP